MLGSSECWVPCIVTGRATLLSGQEGGQEPNLPMALPPLHLTHSTPNSFLTPGEPVWGSSNKEHGQLCGRGIQVPTCRRWLPSVSSWEIVPDNHPTFDIRDEVKLFGTHSANVANGANKDNSVIFYLLLSCLLYLGLLWRERWANSLPFQV